MRKNVDLHTTLLIYVINGQVLLGFKNRGFGQVHTMVLVVKYYPTRI